MKRELIDMNYSEFIEYLNKQGIRYDQSEHSGFPSDIIEVIPKDKRYKSRSFIKDIWGKDSSKNLYDKQDSKQDLYNKRTKIDRMDYRDFLDFLNEYNVQYDETKAWCYNSGFYIGVTPRNKKFKKRNFYCLTFEQEFGENDWYNYYNNC